MVTRILLEEWECQQYGKRYYIHMNSSSILGTTICPHWCNGPKSVGIFIKIIKAYV